MKTQILHGTKEQDAFTAGWEAHRRYVNHEWGPEPPDTPEVAKREWQNTCNWGHVIRVRDCKMCRKLKRQQKDAALRED